MRFFILQTLRIFLLTSLFSATVYAQMMPVAPPIAAKSWLLIDHGSQQVLSAYRAGERIEPASLTKLMTAYLTFSALKQKTLTLDQIAPISEHAWKAPGSRMFLEPNKPVTVEKLIHGMIVQSGNDACIALAEAIAGSEARFVQMMNYEAQRLGMKNTHFTNSMGLPDPQHYTTAKDLSLLVSALMRDFPNYYYLYSIKEYTYNHITQPNRNRLLWTDSSVDGVKTGHTDTAGYCLIASAKRGSRRLISIVLGTASDTMRVQESQKLLNFGFQFYDTLKIYENGQTVSQLRVWKGAQNLVKAGFLSDLVLSVPKGQQSRIKMALVSKQPLIAPVRQGQWIGTLRIYFDDKPLGDYQVVALDAIPMAGLLGRAWDTIRLWLE